MPRWRSCGRIALQVMHTCEELLRGTPGVLVKARNAGISAWHNYLNCTSVTTSPRSTCCRFGTHVEYCKPSADAAPQVCLVLKDINGAQRLCPGYGEVTPRRLDAAAYNKRHITGGRCCIWAESEVSCYLESQGCAERCQPLPSRLCDRIHITIFGVQCENCRRY